MSPQVVAERGTMIILKARFPYARWDGWRVGEHLLVVPIRHTSSFSDMTELESADMMGIIQSYEAAGYSFYIRSASNRSRTMAHVHGHLIKAKA
ncbi:HIT domain-containing protein [Candidatus Saccharibacteria bacterium]|nr:HIT domain-containing protein [Candidatus Saccharibacteria bacterium]